MPSWWKRRYTARVDVGPKARRPDGSSPVTGDPPEEPIDPGQGSTTPAPPDAPVDQAPPDLERTPLPEVASVAAAQAEPWEPVSRANAIAAEIHARYADEIRSTLVPEDRGGSHGRHSISEQVRSALVDHSFWKVRLAEAIHDRGSEFSPNVVGRDDQCAFGKWLYSETDPALKNDGNYEDVRQSHAEFHRAAAEVLRLVQENRTAEARAAILPPSDFVRASARLNLALTAWQIKVGG
jgi:hypothetical protein